MNVWGGGVSEDISLTHPIVHLLHFCYYFISFHRVCLIYSCYLQAMDGDFYDKAREVYMFYAQIEADTASMIKAEFEDLRDQSYLVSSPLGIELHCTCGFPLKCQLAYASLLRPQVNREYNLQCYLDGSPVLREAIDYVFEPYGQDKVTVLSRDHGAEIFLDKDARKWATMLVKQQNGIAQIDKQVRGLKSVTAAYIKVGNSACCS